MTFSALSSGDRHPFYKKVVAMKAFSVIGKVHAWYLFHQAHASEKGGISIEAAFVFGTLIAIAILIATRFVDLGNDVVNKVPTSL